MPLERPSRVLIESKWRTGRKVGRTIYAMWYPERTSDSDLLIGVMDSAELAEEVVTAHNKLWEARSVSAQIVRALERRAGELEEMARQLEKGTSLEEAQRVSGRGDVPSVGTLRLLASEFRAIADYAQL